ncbi:MAG: D-2-hydroxyacid dehydrogenase [bacterium]|nr:D-2-hydroxyacid dehydrogenase [bacterium]MDT8365873.1 D-2-hydroxyacid dehydrogenase [bacterium]
MKIVVLDGYTLNPGDLSWDDLKALGDCIVHDRTAPDELVERGKGAQVLLTNKVVLDREAIGQLPELAYIGVQATGVNVVDLEAARDRGIVITNVPAYGTDSVAQFVFALLLEHVNSVGHHTEAVHAGKWSACADFSFHERPLVELAGMTLGIVGYGAIGRAVARIAEAFGMVVIVHTRTPCKSSETRFVDLETVFAEGDVVSLHCPLTPETKRLVNSRRLKLMKNSAILINTSRGPLVDEAALADALNGGQIAGAALDVLSVEPPPENNPLLAARNCTITPHIAWATLAARKRLMDTVVGNVKAWMEGRPRNVVS